MNRKKIMTLIVVLSSIMLTSCGVEESHDNTNLSKDIGSEENVKTTSLGDNQKVEYDEVVSVVDEFWKAKVKLDIENTVSYCTGSYKKEANKKMKDLVKEQEEVSGTILDAYVEWVQLIFFECAEEDDDIIDASYLYDDKDVCLAANELVTYIISNSMSYSLPKKAEMLSKNKATVTMHTFSKKCVENDVSLLEMAKSYLQSKVLEELVDDAGFIKKTAAKKMMKQAVLGSMNDIKKIYEASDETEMGTRIFHLKKKNGKWLIYKVEINEKSFTDNSDEEDDYYEDNSEEDEEIDYYEDNSEEDDYFVDENDSSYILENSDNEYLTEDDLLDLSSKQLTYARNEIYARHGYVFKSSELNDYFGQQDWYEADYEFDGKLDDVEKYNAEFILNYQNENGMTYAPK